MNESQNTQELASRSVAEWMPAWAGLLMAIGLAWWACPVPPPHLLTWDALLLYAVRYVFLVLLACAGAASIGFAIVPRRSLFSSRDVTVRLLMGTAWLAPLVIFVFLRSVWVLGVVVVMAATVTRAFRYFGSAENESVSSGQGLAVGQSSPRMFQCADPTSSFRPLLLPFFIAICVQAGAMIAVAGYKLAAAMVLGVSTAMLVWFFPSAAARASSTRKRALFLSLALTLALMLTLLGLAPFLNDEGFFSAAAAQGGPLVRILLRAIFGDRALPPPAPPPSTEVKDQGGTGAYKGVILSLEEPRAILLAPPPPETPAVFVISSVDNPSSLPFHGVYWFFKYPDTRPPERSYKVRGSPEKMGLHSSDVYPLLMEAHQDLSSLIDLKCCGRIQVVVRNADLHPGTVSLELRLSNRTMRGKPYISLGRATVTSKLPSDAADDAPPVEEKLSFMVPAAAAIRQFDEITILFRLNPERAGSSARIAIDRFVFLPRGR